MTTLEQRVSALEVQMQEIQATLAQVAQLQLQGQQQLNQLELAQQTTQKQIDQTQAQLNNFIREQTRINAKHGEQIERFDAATEANRVAVGRLTSTLDNTNQRLGDLIDHLRNK